MAPVRAESATAKRPSARGFAPPSGVISVNIGSYAAAAVGDWELNLGQSTQLEQIVGSCRFRSQRVLTDRILYALLR